jgi:hypothetical protein
MLSPAEEVLMEDLEASIESLLALDDHQHEYLEAALKLADWHLQNDRRDRARAHVKRALTLCLPSSAATVAGDHAPGPDSGVPVGHPNAHVVVLPDPADRYAVADAALYLWKTEAHAPSTRDKVRVNLSAERHRLASTAARVLEHVIAELRPPVPIAVEPPVEPDKPPEVDWRTPMYAEPPPPKEEEPPPPSNPVLDRAKLRLATIREATGACRWTTLLLSHAPLLRLSPSPLLFFLLPSGGAEGLHEALALYSELIVAQSSHVDLRLVIFRAAVLLKHIGSTAQAMEYLEYLTDEPPPDTDTDAADAAGGGPGGAKGLGSGPTNSYSKLHLLAFLGLTYEDAPDKYSLIMKEVYQQVTPPPPFPSLTYHTISLLPLPRPRGPGNVYQRPSLPRPCVPSCLSLTRIVDDTVHHQVIPLYVAEISKMGADADDGPYGGVPRAFSPERKERLRRNDEGKDGGPGGGGGVDAAALMMTLTPKVLWPPPSLRPPDLVIPLTH